MRVNTFVKFPLRVEVHDPIASTIVAQYYVLGNVPSAVSDAVKRVVGITNNTATTSDRTILAGFYGKNYKARLNLLTDVEEKNGGEDGSDADIERLLADDSAPEEKITTGTATAITINTTVSVYPEDKMSELRDKLYLVTSIPPYRQHIYYRSDRLHQSYDLSINGVYTVDINKAILSSHTVAGMPVDKYMYMNRAHVRVQASESFTILNDVLSTPECTRVIYVCDLAFFTRRAAVQLAEAIKDTYQRDLIYYGFVLKYFPLLSQEAFVDYVANEPELQHKYPDLAKNMSMVAAIAVAEKEIVDFDYANIAKVPTADLSIAITQMTAIINSGQGIVLNIRNIFDYFRVSAEVPEIRAHIGGGGKNVYLVRKHQVRAPTDIAFPTGNSMKTGVTFAIVIRADKYLFLNVTPSGKYFIKSTWDEEDRLGFVDVIKIMKAMTAPIIAKINGFGRYAFIAGNVLKDISLIQSGEIGYTGLSICIFWHKVVTDGVFKLIKHMWEPYMRARITGARSAQQFDSYEFLFRKGMYESDPDIVERIVAASNKIVLTNQYAHLTDNAVKQKWEQAYGGRIVRMAHQITDIRFEIIDVHDNEFEIFYKYVSMFVYRATLDKRTASTVAASDVRRLKKLREQDPELFNLKKHGSPRMYSIICQNQHQPLIYTPGEIDAASPATVKKLTKYWNFTTQRPAYYGCPDSTYPHLSFILGAHPKHYCLPCCSKRLQAAGSERRQKIVTACLTQHFLNKEDLGKPELSRHIINYQKDVDVGRLSKLPRSAMRELLVGIAPHEVPGNKKYTRALGNKGVGYYIVGVPQHLPGANNLGVIFSVAEALEISVATLVKNILSAVGFEESFGTLLGGAITDYFVDHAALAAELREIFMENRVVVKATADFTGWSALFLELFYRFLGVTALIFVDDAGSGKQVDLYTASPLTSGNTDQEKFVLVMKKATRYRPIFLLAPDEYFRNFGVLGRTFTAGSPTATVLMSVLRGAEDILFVHPLDYNGAVGAAKFNGGSIELKYVNRSNHIYAVMIGGAYIPIEYSANFTETPPVPISQRPYERDAGHPVKLSVFLGVVEQINAFLSAPTPVGARKYKPLVVQELLKGRNGEIYGATVQNMFAAVDTADVESTLPCRTLKYDPCAVNMTIFKRDAGVTDTRTRGVNAAMYKNSQYKLFLLEFVNYLDRERDEVTRTKLRDLVLRADLQGDITAFRTELAAVLKDYPQDYLVIQGIITNNYRRREAITNQNVIDAIDKTSFDFDRTTLKLLERGDKTVLADIAAKITIRKDMLPGNKFPNVYMPCDIQSTIASPFYCANRRLIVTSPVEEFVRLLSDDLKNPLKIKYLLGGIFMDTCRRTFDFIKAPGEKINVYVIGT